MRAADAPPVQTSAGGKGKLWDRNWPVAFAFLAPNFAGFLAFTLFPVILSLFMAFHHWTLRPHEAIEFVGLRNFSDLLGIRSGGGESAPVTLVAYALSVVALIVGLITALQTNARAWPGTRLGGAAIAATGLGLISGSWPGTGSGYLRILVRRECTGYLLRRHRRPAVWVRGHEP